MEKLIEIAADITKNPAIALGSYGLAFDSEDQLVQKNLLKCQAFPCVNQSLLAGGLVHALDGLHAVRPAFFLYQGLRKPIC